MTTHAPTGCAAHDLGWLLTGLVESVPHTRSALLLTTDGMARAAHGLDADGADHLAALAAALCSLGHGTGARFAGGGVVRQIAVELDTAVLFVTAAGPGTCLAVLAGPGADPALLGYEMARLVDSVRPHLAVPLRKVSVRPLALPS